MNVAAEMRTLLREKRSANTRQQEETWEDLLVSENRSNDAPSHDQTKRQKYKRWSQMSGDSTDWNTLLRIF